VGSSALSYQGGWDSESSSLSAPESVSIKSLAINLQE
jgi:hypothetical protein